MKVLNHQPRGALGEAAAHVSLLLLRSSTAVLAALLLFAASQAEAARQQRSHGHARHAAAGPSFALVSESIVVDVETGRVLSAMNADAITYPASLTKMMTLYLVFEALNTGRLRCPAGNSKPSGSTLHWLTFVDNGRLEESAADLTPGTRRARSTSVL